MDHADVRTLLSVGETTDAIERHLAGCGDCRAWNEALAQVRRLAVLVAAPPAPEGLAERSIAAARQWAGAAQRAAAVRYVPSRVPWWRRVAWRAATATALAGAVAAGALTIPGRDGGDSPQRLELVAAARNTADAKTARVRFSGDMRATFEVRLPEMPEPAFPADFLQNLDRLPQEMRAEFERQMERFRTEARAAADALPRSMTFEMRMRGAGEVVFPDGLHLRGTITPVGDVPLPIGGPFELIVVGDRAWIKMAITGGKWVRIPAARSPFRLTFKPGGLLALMRAEGDVEDLGEETLDGERVRHYRLTEEMSVAADRATGSSTFDSWVGADDGILRKVEAAAAGRMAAGVATGEFSSRGSMQLYDFGADVSVTPPSDDEVTDGSALFTSGGVTMGVGDAGFSVAIRASAATTAPKPPTVTVPPTEKPSPYPTPTGGTDGTSYEEKTDSSPPPEWSPYPEPSPEPSPSWSPWPEPSPSPSWAPKAYEPYPSPSPSPSAW